MRLKELREAAHESQQSLAIEMNISQAMVSRYELEQASPDVTTLIHLANHYNVSVDYLIGRTDVKTMYTKSDLSESEQNILFMYKGSAISRKAKPRHIFKACCRSSYQIFIANAKIKKTLTQRE